MAVLTLKDAARWKKIERQFPAGLPDDVLALTTAIETAPASLVRHGVQAKSAEPVFLVIPYDVLVPTAEYLAYLDEYVLPLLFLAWSGVSSFLRRAFRAARGT